MASNEEALRHRIVKGSQLQPPADIDGRVSSDGGPVNAQATETQICGNNPSSTEPTPQPRDLSERVDHKPVASPDMSIFADFFKQQTEVLRSMDDRLKSMDERQAAADTYELKSMNERLKSIDERQAAADTSMKPIPQLPANSSSTWMALWQSFKDQVNPAVERLRGGLDALLVFIGLFSAIVTAFLVDSAKNLKQDESSRTNDLLTNLTEVVLAISGKQFANLSLPYETAFTPESSDVRPNAYWFISLVISLLVAAISVLCRGFLASVMETNLKSTTPSLALTEVHIRWENAERYLKPLVEGVPQLMVLPVMLFILGLLDTLFSLNSKLAGNSPGIISAFAICCALAFLTVTVLICFLVHGIKYSETSPFQSLFSKWLSEHSEDHQDVNKPHKDDLTVDSSRKLSKNETATFSKILQTTSDDSVLEQGSAILKEVLKLMDRSTYYRLISSAVVDVLIYTLSPEASFRSNLTAVEFISETIGSDSVFRHREPEGHNATRLLQSCIDLAKRIEATRGSRVLLDSGVFRAICSLVRPNYYISLLGLPDVFRLLYWENSELIDRHFSTQLTSLSVVTAMTYTTESIESNVDLIWSNYGSVTESSDARHSNWMSPTAKDIISHSLRIHSRTSLFGKNINQSIFQNMIRVLPLDRQIQLFIPLSKLSRSRDEPSFLALQLKALYEGCLQKNADLNEVDIIQVTECVQALVVMTQRLQPPVHLEEDSLNSAPASFWDDSCLEWLIKSTTLFVGHPSSQCTSSFKDTIIKLLHAFDDVVQRFKSYRWRNFDHDSEFGAFVTRCLELWPDIKVPPRALQDDFKTKFYPLLDGWERRIDDDDEVLFYNKHTDSTTKDFPGSPANPTEITPADIMLPEDDDELDRSSDWALPNKADGDAESSDLSGPDNGDEEGSNDNVSTDMESAPRTSRFVALPERMSRVLRGIRIAGRQLVDERRSGTIGLAERGQAADPTRAE